MKELLARIRKILHDRRVRRFLTRVVSITAAIVVFITTYALVLPAITMESRANCGIEAHQHDDSCYEEVLVCDLEEDPGHHHDESCYSTKLELVCRLDEHTHDSSCFDEEGKLICGLKEHVHSDTCYKEIRELVCQIPESDGHQHTQECYKKILTCGKEAHIHSAACYKSDAASTAVMESAAVASTESAAVAETKGNELSAGSVSSETGSAWPSAGNMGNTGSAGSTGVTSAADSAGYVPVLDELNISAVFNKRTGIYYSRPETDAWKKADHQTEVTESDNLRLYLAYTIPAGALNETNTVARYRLPGGLRLTDVQLSAINTTVNGIASQYVDMDTLEILDYESYSAALGLEAVEGTRNPSDDLEEYLAHNGGQEFISATVKAENVFDQVTGDFQGQDLIFTFTNYTVSRNRHEYDADGQPVKAGEEVSGWLGIDVTADAVDWQILNSGKNTEKTAEIIFVEEDRETGLKEISTELKLAAAVTDEDTVVDIVPDEDSGEDAVRDIVPDEDSDEEAVKDIVPEEDTDVDTVVDIVPDEDTDVDTIRDVVPEKDTDEDAVKDIVPDEDAVKDIVPDEDAVKDIVSDEDADKDTVEDIVPEEESVNYPPGAFDDIITVAAGSLSTDTEAAESADNYSKIAVHVEADADTFPEGTTMVLSAVSEDRMNTVAEAVEGAVDAPGTMGFHAVDISFHDRNGREIEPLKPIRVSMTSDAIKRTVEDQSTAPVVVHIEDDARSADAVDEAAADGNAGNTGEGTLTFEAAAFSIYAIVYTVDFHWLIDGQDYSYSMAGGSAITLSELLPIVGIVADDENTGADEVKAFLKDVESVEFSSPELVWVEKAESETTIGAIEDAGKLEIQYSAEVTEEQRENYREKTVSAGDWALISIQSFTSEETLTVTLKNGTAIEIRVTDEVITVESTLLKYANGSRTFYLFANSGINAPYDYYLKYNGQAAQYPASRRERYDELDSVLGDDYAWTLTQDGSGKWFIRNVGHPDYYITLKSSGTITSGDSNTPVVINPRNDTGSYDGFQIVNDDTTQAINFYYYNQYNYGFNTVLRKDSWGARFKMIPRQLVVNYTQDDLNHGHVSFPYKSRTLTTSQNYTTASIYTNTTWKGNQSGAKVTAVPEDGYHFLRWDTSGPGRVISWGSGGETDTSTAIQPFIDDGDVTFTAVFEKNPEVSFTQDDLSHGYVQYNAGTGNVKTTAGHPELTVVTKANGQAVYPVTAVPNIGYHFVEWQVVDGSANMSSWGSGNVVTKNSQMIQPVITGDGVKLKAVFAENPIIVATQNDIEKGHVKYNNGTSDVLTNSGENSISVPTTGPSSEGEYQSASLITAVPEEGYRFLRWEISGSGTLKDWGNDSTINEKSIQVSPYIQNGDVTLTAVFEKIPSSLSDLDPNSAAGKLVSELEEEMKRDSASMTKTAHVLDEEERTYQIELAASSERKVIGPTIELSFITDVSRSMWFPANLEEVKYGSNDNLEPDYAAGNLVSWLNKNGINSDGSYKVFYMIVDLNETATVLAVYHEGGEWRTMDASYYDDKINNRTVKAGRAAKLNNSEAFYLDSSLGWVIKTGADKDYMGSDSYSRAYPINDLDSNGNIKLYTAYATSDDDGSYYTRLDYLQKALDIICDVVYAVDPSASLGLITFAKESYTRYGDNGTKRISVNSDIYVANQYKKGEKINGKTIDEQVQAIALTGGTRQDYGLQTAKDVGWYEAKADHQQVAILITDGAPNVENTGITNPWTSKIAPAAADLKNLDVELYTLGLSLENVGTNKKSLYSIAGKKGDSTGSWNEAAGLWSGIDSKYQNNAETGEDLINTFMDIIRNLEVVGNLLGTVSDTVDEAFYPIDANGKPIEEGVYTADGIRLGAVGECLNANNKPLEKITINGEKQDSPIYSARNDIPYYTWTKEDGKWTITWYNQLITKAKDDGSAEWNKSFRVKAREDFLGGNAINTNADEAILSADRFMQQGYPTYIGTFDEPVTSSVETPRVNVAELGLDERSTQWTVYIDTSVNSIAEIRALFDAVQVHERVTKTDGENRIAADGSSCLPADESSATFALADKLTLSESDWSNLIAGQVVETPYTDYRHKNIGTFKVELVNEGQVKEGTLEGEHPAAYVGVESEKYTLKITYTPKPADAATIWNTTAGKEPGREADEITSTNLHSMNVYAIPLRIIKKDDNGNLVTGAVFSIFRAKKEGETGISIEEYDKTRTGADYFCVDTQESDVDGVCVLGQPSMGETSQNLLTAGETYYLIETAAPAGYKRDETVKIVTLETTEGIYSDLTGRKISAKDYPFNWDQGVTMKIDGTPGAIVDMNGDLSSPVDSQGNPRSYILNSDQTTFQTTVINTKLANLAIRKVDVGNSSILLAHAVFSLYDADAVDDNGKIKKNAVALKTGITTLSGEELGYADIEGLNLQTYYLVETETPDGYVFPDYDYIRITITATDVRYQEGPSGEPKTAEKISRNGEEVYCIQIYNNPGAELPSAGSCGTNAIYLTGFMLALLSGALLLIRGIVTT